MAISLDQLIQECATGVAPSTMAAIIRVESKGNPWAIGDNTAHTAVKPTPRNKEEAIKKANELLSVGHNLDLGISQINNTNLKTYGKSVSDIFDPCTNISVGSKILSNFYWKAVTKYGEGNRSLFHSLSAYNTGSFFRGPAYVQKILNAAGSNADISNIAWNKSQVIKVKKTNKNNNEIYRSPIYSTILSFPHIDDSNSDATSKDGILALGSDL